MEQKASTILILNHTWRGHSRTYKYGVMIHMLDTPSQLV